MKNTKCSFALFSNFAAILKLSSAFIDSISNPIYKPIGPLIRGYCYNTSIQPILIGYSYSLGLALLPEAVIIVFSLEFLSSSQIN